MNRPRKLWPWQAGLLVAIFVFWHVMTTPGLLPNFMFDNDRQAAFFFGEPLKMLGPHLGLVRHRRRHLPPPGA